MEKNNLKTIITIASIIIIGAGIYYSTTRSQRGPAPVDQGTHDVTVDDIRGCYVARLARDVYSLNIASIQGDNVQGTLVFKNFDKDSSSGTFKGTFVNSILLGEYTFNSEGMSSITQAIFKKVGTTFIRGYGPMNATGDHFADLNAITYDQNQTFKATSEACATSLLSPATIPPGTSVQAALKVGQTKVINGVSLTFNKIVQDSRCPVDVACIQAGAVMTNITLKNGTKTETLTLSSDQRAHMFAGYSVSISGVDPSRMSKVAPDLLAYVVTFRVEK